MARIHTKKIKSGESLSIRYQINGEAKELFLGSRYSKTYVREIALNVDKIVMCIETGATASKSLIAWIEEVFLMRLSMSFSASFSSRRYTNGL